MPAALEPLEVAAALERSARLPDGAGDRFSGYAVLGVSFATGDVLALRRFVVTSVGAGYSSVWHRDPGGRWTFYTDVEPGLGCGRYFSEAVDEEVRAPIGLEWTTNRTLRVTVDGGRLVAWSLNLRSTLMTRAISRLAATLPEPWWHNTRVLESMSAVARMTLGTGRFNMVGETPNRYRFMANPLALWSIADSHAVMAGRDLGAIAPLKAQVALGDFWVPRRPLFAIARAFMYPSSPPADAPAMPQERPDTP